MSHHHNPERRLYREHKYLTVKLCNLEQEMARCDFREADQVKNLKQNLNDLIELLQAHADHEEANIHPLLKKNESPLAHQIESDHQYHVVVFNKWKEQLAAIDLSDEESEKVNLGHQFYLNYRKFFADLLHHLNQEENIIMPELLNLCSEKELRAIDFELYNEMSAEQIIEMLTELFPVMNADDREYFIADLAEAVPSKLKSVWPKLVVLLTEKEAQKIASKYL